MTAMKIAVLTVALAVPGTAQEQGSQSDPKNAIGTGVQDPQIDFFDSVADYFRYSPGAVRAIYKKGASPEQVVATLYLAKFSRMTANQVISARNAGKDWNDLAREAGLPYEGSDFVEHANTMFLSRYHARPAADIKKMRDAGATWVAINQQFRREGKEPAKTEEIR